MSERTSETDGIGQQRDPVVVQRDVELDAPGSVAWDLIGTAGGWDQWLARDVDVDVVPGSGGTLVDDDGQVWEVHVDEVVEGEHVTFRWSPLDEPDSTSTVSITLAPLPGRTVVTIIEVRACAPVAAGAVWGWRAIALHVACATARALAHA